MQKRVKMISVIIPTYNEEENIGLCLTSLQNQTFKDFEIIIIDDGSTDKTLNIVKSFKRVRILKQKHGGPGRARNLGARKARGDILAFVDADMEFDPEYLARVTKDIRTGRCIGTAYGYEEARNFKKSNWAKCFNKVRWDGYRKGLKEYVVFSAILRSKFLEVGGFDPSRGYADDSTLPSKLKAKSRVVDAKCYHNNPASPEEIYKQFRWMGKAFISNLKRDRRVRNKFFLMLFSAVLAVVILGVLIKSFLGILIIGLSILIALVLFETIKKVRKESWILGIIYYPMFLFIKYTAFIHGIFINLLTGRNEK